MSQMLKSSGAVAAATTTSRVLGLVREIVYARFMGDGWVAGAFMLAFMIPNLFRRLLGEGALTAAFIPAFKEKEKLAGEHEMWRAANAVISGLLVTTVLITLVGVGVVSLLLLLPQNPKFMLMLQLLRWMFPYVVLVCLAAIFMGMLNSRGHFFVPALGAALLNVVMIASVLWLAPKMGQTLDQKIFGLALGVLAAGCIQALMQTPLLYREGWRFSWVPPWKEETVRRVGTQMLPATIGVAAFQINVVLTQGLAYWLDTTSSPIVAPFNYAVRLMELPQGVFGLSLATYLLPTLSGMAAEKKYPEFRATLQQGLGYLIFVNLLASVLLVILAEPMIRLLFQRGAFDEASTDRAALALQCLAPGLVSFSVVNILARSFYAVGDIKTPMKISIFCLILNLLFTVPLVFAVRQGGLGIANTLSSIINCLLLFYALKRRLGKLEMDQLRQMFIYLLGIVFVAGSVCWLTWRWWNNSIGHDGFPQKLGAVFVPMAAAGVVYLGLAVALRLPVVSALGELLQRIRRR